MPHSTLQQTEHREPKLGTGTPHLASFDYLRVLAMILVTLQHGMAVAGYYEQTTRANVNMGQAGVGLFCALSGYLAFSGSTTSALGWLKKRLWQIFPAYWIATVTAFLLTWAAGTKHIDGWLFLSQMAGTGYFTHGWELINVVSWFISLILLCYGIAFIGKAIDTPRLVLLMAAGIALALLATHTEVSLSRHVLTFCVAGFIAQHRPRLTMMLAIIAGLFGAALVWSQSVYAAFGIALVLLALTWQGSANNLTRLVSNHIYEYFLVHGIFLVALARFAPEHKLLSGAIAVILSIISAVILKKLTEYLISRVRLFGSTKAAAA